MTSAPVVLLATTPDRATADLISFAFVHEKYAACVSIVEGIASVYCWNGAVESVSECMLIIKTTHDRVDRLIVRYRELHPYDVPELIVLPIVDGLHGYLAWLSASVQGEAGG